MYQYSDDGGRTWSAERWLFLGETGDYTRRFIMHAQGRAQNRVYKFSTTSPVVMTLIDLFAEVEASP